MKKRIILVGLFLVLSLATSAQAFNGLMDLVFPQNIDLDNISPISSMVQAPIPGTLVLLGTSLAGLGLMRFRKRK